MMGRKKKQDKDIYEQIAEYIKLLMLLCEKTGLYLKIDTTYIAPAPISDYRKEQLLWSKAETYEIYSYLDPESSLYKGDRITKDDIIDAMIDLKLFEKGKN